MCILHATDINRRRRKAIMDAQVPAREISNCQNDYWTCTEVPEAFDSDHDQASTGSCWQSTHHDDMEPVPSTLPELRVAIHEWQMEWEPKADWDHNFNLALCQAREKSWSSADRFFRECETHAHMGRCFIRALRQLVHELCHSRGSRDKLCDTFLQIFDLLVAVVSEVKFFEVKLHKFAPSNPLSKCSDICMYAVV